MCDQGVHDRWTHVTNIRVIKHVQLTYEKVNAMHDLVT